ncbi:unnamed protein product [Fasciola hepatica]|uniref:Uncharacterized protein n=1 Tax=Fasciola hepatica TaxID=6192 RepID=A0ABC9HI10_FASHE
MNQWISFLVIQLIVLLQITASFNLTTAPCTNHVEDFCVEYIESVIESYCKPMAKDSCKHINVSAMGPSVMRSCTEKWLEICYESTEILSKHEGLHNTCNEAYQKRCGEYSKKYVGKTNCTKYPDGKCQNNDNETGKVPQTKIHSLGKQNKSKRNSNKRPKIVKTRKNATKNSSLTRMSNLGKQINFKISSKKRRTIVGSKGNKTRKSSEEETYNLPKQTKVKRVSNRKRKVDNKTKSIVHKVIFQNPSVYTRPSRRKHIRVDCEEAATIACHYYKEDG